MVLRQNKDTHKFVNILSALFIRLYLEYITTVSRGKEEVINAKASSILKSSEYT